MVLRAAGHEVYDFTDPACRKAPEIPPEKFPEQFDPEQHRYADYLQTVPHWRQAVEGNQKALQWCDAVALLLPSGMDAHADAYYGLGLGKHLAVIGHPKAGERTPTHMWANVMLDDDAEVIGWLQSLERAATAPQGDDDE